MAQKTFRERGGSAERHDAVMYLLGAIQKFEGMSNDEIQKIGFEIATLGRHGFDINDSAQIHRLTTLPGQYSGLHCVCIMFAAFKVVLLYLELECT
jgi:hypothetical protein